MTDSKVSEPSKVKVEDVLADFFMKKMTKEDGEHALHSNEKKHKKHKKKKKKKHTHHSSSSFEESDIEERSSKHKRKWKTRSRSRDRKRRSHSSSVSPQRKKESKHKHRSSSLKRNSADCKISYKKHSHSKDSIDRKKELGDCENSMVTLAGVVCNGYNNNENHTEEQEDSKLKAEINTLNTVACSHETSESPTYDFSQSFAKHLVSFPVKSASSSMSSSEENPEIVSRHCDSRLKSSSIQEPPQALEANKSEYLKGNNNKDAELTVNKTDFTEKLKREVVLEVKKQICPMLTNTSQLPSISDPEIIKEENSNFSLSNDKSKEIERGPEGTKNKNGTFKEEKHSTDCEISNSAPDLKKECSSNDSVNEVNCSRNDNSKLKQKLSLLKRQELLEKFTKHEEMYKEMALSKPKKTHSSSEKYEEDSKYHSSKRKHQSRNDHGASEDDDSARKYHKSLCKKSKDRRNKHSPCNSPNSDRGQSIDKAKLLEVARKNALKMMEKGTLPQGISTEVLKKDHVVAIKAGGKSVKELTDFCRNLSSKEGVSSDVQDIKNDLEENEQPFIHHPFKLKEASTIKLNIKNSVQLPVKSHAEKVTENARMLSLQFPVSSGNQHRKKELEWIPVEKDQSVTNKSVVSVSEKSVNVKTDVVTPQTRVPAAFEAVPVTTVIPPIPTPPYPPLSSLPSYSTFHTKAPTENVPPALCAIRAPSTRTPACNSAYPARNATRPFTFDIQACVVKRCLAITKLKQNPCDIVAANELSEAQMQIQTWIESQQMPGQFTGRTDVKMLTVEELSGPRPVWVKKQVIVLLMKKICLGLALQKS